jgi:hypothetical protein
MKWAHDNLLTRFRMVVSAGGLISENMNKTDEQLLAMARGKTLEDKLESMKAVTS